MPDIWKLLIVFAVMVILLWKRMNLGTVLLIGAAATAIALNRSFPNLIRDLVDALTDITTIRLAVIITLILGLGALLERTARLRGMVSSLEALTPDGRINLAFVPALIGMLPMVGGAMFSAPMVGELGDKLEIDSNRKTFVNYWFRHVWEWVLPTYPSLILAAALIGHTPRDFSVRQWPMTVAAIFAGIVIGLVPIKLDNDRVNDQGRRQSLILLIRSIWPILLVIVLSVIMRIDLVISLVLTLILMIIMHRMTPRQVFSNLKRSLSLRPIYLIIAVMIFRHMLNTTGAVAIVLETLKAIGIPTTMIIFLIPMLSGFLTGLAPGAVGVGFPVIIPLLASHPAGMTAAVLAYSGGFLGVLISPLHLCLSLTKEYFNANWGMIYRLLVPSVLIVGVVAAVVYFSG